MTLDAAPALIICTGFVTTATARELDVAVAAVEAAGTSLTGAVGTDVEAVGVGRAGDAPVPGMGAVGWYFLLCP